MSSFILALTLTLGQSPITEFEVKAVDSDAKVGEIQSIQDGTILLKNGKSVASKDWYSLRRATVAIPDWLRSPHVELVNGDRIVGAILKADGDKLQFQLALPGQKQILNLPVSALRVAWLARAPVEPPNWLGNNRARDVFQSRNGDLTQGSLTAIDVERGDVTYQTDGKDRHLDIAKIAAIGFNTDLARVRRPKGPYYRAVLADGSRLSAASVSFDGTVWKLETLFRDIVSLPADQLISLDVEQGVTTYLSGLKPAKYAYHTFDGEQHSWSADRAENGDALRLKLAGSESTFDRGVGLHADCTITYSLAGKYKRFEALAGLDARSGVRGDLVLSVSVDGKEQVLPGGGRLNFAKPPLDLRVDIAGAKELTISVRRANGANVDNHLNLADARLVPSP